MSNKVIVRFHNNPKYPWPVRQEVFDTYWKIAAERQSIFFNKLRGEEYPWTTDEILLKHKFTNAYRASDRVSQYLIRNIIYQGDQTPEEVIFRTLIFKLFNRIETWEYIVHELGVPDYAYFSFKELASLLDGADKIFSNAYMLTGHKFYGYDKKHWNYLMAWYDMLVTNDVLSDLVNARSLETLFNILNGQKGIKEFLAYQYATDINYGASFGYGENTFTYPGNGAVRGITKCFDLDFKEAKKQGKAIIMWMVEHQKEQFDRLGIDFQNLFGRSLRAIDCQNLFCETDKYSRVAFPELEGHGRSRIKQRYHVATYSGKPIDYFYPPSWNINKNID